MSLNFSASSMDDEGSPKEADGHGYGNEDDDNSILWSAVTGGGASFLNGSRHYSNNRNSVGPIQTSYHSTPVGLQRNGTTNGTSSRDAVRRFPPRPSPERLQAQVKSLELTQEKMFHAMEEQSRSLQETMETLISETRQTREATSKERDKGTGWLSDNSKAASVEMHLKGIHDTVKGIQKEVEGMRKDVITINQKRNSSPTESGSESQSSRGRALELSDLQEALTQQTALIQMSSYGLIGPLLAANAAVRQPVPSIPPAGVIPQSQQVVT